MVVNVPKCLACQGKRERQEWYTKGVQEEGVIGFVCFSSKKHFSTHYYYCPPICLCWHSCHVSKIDLMTQTKDILEWNTFALRYVMLRFPPFFSVLIKKKCIGRGLHKKYSYQNSSLFLSNANSIIKILKVCGGG